MPVDLEPVRVHSREEEDLVREAVSAEPFFADQVPNNTHTILSTAALRGYGSGLSSAIVDGPGGTVQTAAGTRA